MPKRFACITFNPAFGPGGNGRRGGGAYLAAPLGTGLIVVAGGSSGNAGQPRGSCMLGAWRCCWAAYRVVGLSELARGCPREIRPSCRRRRRWRRHLRARARLGRPGDGQ